MSAIVITRVETSGADKRLHLDIPVDEADRKYRLEIKLTPEAAPGWPPGFFESVCGKWVGEFARDQGWHQERVRFDDGGSPV